MKREDWSDLALFVAIAEEGSFKKAATRFGLSSSALSHAISHLEERLGVRLLSRTTRSVAPTDAGDRLLATLKPAMTDISSAVERLGTLREHPAGPVRITCARTVAVQWIVPRLPELARRYPDVTLELSIDAGFVDIVTSRFDAGVRLGEAVAKDMISVRVGSDERAAVVASPEYFARNPAPRTPSDLARHRCVGYRHVTSGALYRWEFEKNGRAQTVAVENVLVTNDDQVMMHAALRGIGLTYVWERECEPHLESGALVRVLEDWCPPFAGSFLYYPAQRHVTPALRAVIDVLRYVPPARR